MILYKRGVTHTTKRGSTKYRDLVAEGRVERDRWLIKPEVQPVNVTNQIVQKMDVKPIIAKLNQVIRVSEPCQYLQSSHPRSTTNQLLRRCGEGLS